MISRRQALIELLRDDEPAVRARAAEALDRLDTFEALPGILGRARSLGRVEWLEFLRSLVGRRDETCLKVGLRCLEHPEEEVRLAALELVESFRDLRAGPAVARHLTDPAPLVRARAVEALGRLGDRRRAAEAASLLADSDDHVLARACETVGLLDHAASEPRLLSLLSHPDPDVRAAAAEGLGRMGVSAPS
ncbi:MAG: HEAT repeat domain-containing protein [Deltaproteobacteria bacterium]|nr:HEAT repeat domain-containing protein [Deltaproteobacteria bacterium]